MQKDAPSHAPIEGFRPILFQIIPSKLDNLCIVIHVMDGGPRRRRLIKEGRYVARATANI